MNWVSPLLVETRYQGQRGKDKGKRRSKITPYVIAELTKIHAERQAAFKMYSADSVGKRFGISDSAVYKIWAELKK